MTYKEDRVLASLFFFVICLVVSLMVTPLGNSIMTISLGVLTGLSGCLTAYSIYDLPN